MITNNEKAQFIFDWHKIKIKIQLAKENEDLYFYKKDIWWASLGSNIGHEEDGKNKTFERPVLILKKFNSHLILIIPLSTVLKGNKFYYYKFVFKKRLVSALVCQIRLISSKRLIRKMGQINTKDFAELRRIIRNFI